MEEKTIKGSLAYEIKATETQYSFTYERSLNNEVGACLVALELIKFNKRNLLETIMSAKGKDKIAVKDRLSKVVTTELILQMLTENLIQQAVKTPELKAEPSTEGVKE